VVIDPLNVIAILDTVDPETVADDVEMATLVTVPIAEDCVTELTVTIVE